ncbi:hypothetical protein [Streptacidiphilus sp. PAMC 29251]
MTPAKPTHTPPRQVRMPHDEWFALEEAAAAEGKTRTDVLRDFARWYLHRPGVTRPTRPEPGAWSRPGYIPPDAQAKIAAASEALQTAAE